MDEKAIRDFTRKVMASEPKMKAVDSRDSVRELVGRVAQGWLIIHGGPDRVQPIEDAVYTPNTPKNVDFEVFILYRPYTNHAWLAKKNADLDRYLQNQFDLQQDQARGLQVLLFDPPALYPLPPGTIFQVPDGKIIAIAGARQGDLEIFLNAYLKLTRY